MLIAAALAAYPGALLARDVPWLPPRRYAEPAPVVVRFLAKHEFVHDGTLRVPGTPFDPFEVEPRMVRMLTEAGFLRVEVPLTARDVHEAEQRAHARAEE